jgi:hypothetical protein
VKQLELEELGMRLKVVGFKTGAKERRVGCVETILTRKRRSTFDYLWTSFQMVSIVLLAGALVAMAMNLINRMNSAAVRGKEVGKLGNWGSDRNNYSTQNRRGLCTAASC